MVADACTTRREFFTAGLGGLVTAAAACSPPAPPDQASPRQGRSTVRTLGRTGLRLPVVSIGLAFEPDLLRAALDAGLVYVHTSGSYAEQNHERILGRVLRGRARDSFVIGSSPDLPYRWKGGGLSDDLGTSTDPAGIGVY